MDIFLAIMPLFAIILLMALSSTTLLQAGLVGMILSIPALYSALPPESSLFLFLIKESARGAWTAWPAVAIILSGLTFQTIVGDMAQPRVESEGRSGELTHRRLFFICFLAGTFTECVTGFGIGSIVVATTLKRLGLPPQKAALLALLSLMLVPWGALSVGTVVGASLIPIAPSALGTATATLSIPLLFGYLTIFWMTCAQLTISSTRLSYIIDLIWVLAISAALYFANTLIPVDIAGLTATGVVALLHYAIHTRHSRSEFLLSCRSVAPYLGLVVTLLFTRMYGPFAHALQQVAVLRPDPLLPTFPILFHASLWIIIVSIICSQFPQQRRPWRSIVNSTWKQGRTASAITLVFVITARWMTASGITERLALSWISLLGSASLAASPIAAAIAGCLTGSSVASNSMMMSSQVAVAGQLNSSVVLAAAIQNTTGSAFTMFSPARIGMVAAVVGLNGSEGSLYKNLIIFAVITMTIMLFSASYISIGPSMISVNR